jgi:glutamate synthase domain-containing protein 2
MCNTNKCPTGIATRDPALRALIDLDEAAQRVAHFFGAAVQMTQDMARACGDDHLGKFRQDDIAPWHREMADLTGIEFSGFQADRRVPE